MFRIDYLSPLSIIIPGIVAIIRLRKIDRIYYPFLYLIWLTSLNEVASLIIVKAGYYTFINNNIYVLPQFLLILVFFRNLGSIKGKFFNITVFSLVILWIFDCFFLGKFSTGICEYFSLTEYLIIVILSINKINELVSTIKGNILRHSVFLICIAFIIY